MEKVQGKRASVLTSLDTQQVQYCRSQKKGQEAEGKKMTKKGGKGDNKRTKDVKEIRVFFTHTACAFQSFC